MDRQLTDCRQFAERLGWRVVDCYIDNDISAYRGTRRPEYERLLADIDDGKVDAVLTWHLDRLNRSPLELERLIGLLDSRQVTIQTVTAGVLDLGTPSGRAVARTLGAWARYESEHKSERICARKHQSALQGAPNGGANRPYGYEDDKVTPVPAEAKIIREAMRRFLAGTPTAVICRDLNARGVPTTGRRVWLSSNLDQILTSPRIAGWRQAPKGRSSRVPGQFLARAQWPPIVSRRAVARAQELMADPTRRPGSHCRLLTGIAVCGICRQPLRLVRHRGKPARYACQPGSSRTDARCGHVSIVAEFLDDYVLNQISDALGHRRSDAATWRAAEIGKAADNGTRQAHSLADLRAAAATTGDLHSVFAAASISRQWDWIRSLTAGISVGPTTRGKRRPDPSRVHISWPL